MSWVQWGAFGVILVQLFAIGLDVWRIRRILERQPPVR